jgi:AcrR family transcriptional regulator
MAETRQSLLKAAAEEFARHGYVGANVNRIAEAAGFSVGTVYNYFPNKRELMLAFIDEIGQTHVDSMVQQVSQETDPGRRLRSFFRAGFEFVEANINETRSIFNTLNGPDMAFRQRIYAAYAPLFELLNNAILNPGIESGSFRADLPATSSGLIMLIYLGVGSQLSPEGQLWIGDQEVADFCLHSLRSVNPTDNQIKR